METEIKTIKINKNKLNLKYNPEILKVDDFAKGYFSDSDLIHKEIAQKLKDKNPYTITIIIENLDPKFWNNKKYVKKTKSIIWPLYKELLYEYFFDEFGNRGGNEVYGKWLDKYRLVWKKDKKKKEMDDYVIENELEPRYKEKILQGYKNREKLFEARAKINRERYYNLPKPLNHIDWRNPYDNIFIWEESGKKIASKGGSGSSGGRQTNSGFIFAFSLINKIRPVKSFLFLYGDDNNLYFISEFPNLTVPAYDIGSNYFLKRSEEKIILRGVSLMSWLNLKNFGKLGEIKITRM